MDDSIGARHDPALTLPPDEKHVLPNHAHAIEPPAAVLGDVITAQPARKHNAFYDDDHIGQEGDEWPTEEELHTLRRVPDKISLAAYTVAFVELCERFSYYGTTALCMCSANCTALHLNIS